MMYEGKAKKIYKTSTENIILMEYKDNKWVCILSILYFGIVGHTSDSSANSLQLTAKS